MKPQFITIVRLLHYGMMASVQDDGNSENNTIYFFNICAVQQECNLIVHVLSLCNNILFILQFVYE